MVSKHDSLDITTKFLLNASCSLKFITIYLIGFFYHKLNTTDDRHIRDCQLVANVYTRFKSMNQENMTKLHHSIFKLRQQLLCASLSLATIENKDTEEEIMIPPIVTSLAKRGLALHEKFGGGRNIAVAKALIGEKPMTLEEIDKIVDFFETNEPDYNDTSGRNSENPSVAWICWCLMGGDGKWAMDMKKRIDEKENINKFRFVVQPEQPRPKTYQPSQNYQSY